MATHDALVEGGWHPYCWDCAETVSRGGRPPVELIYTDEPDPFDPDDLVLWAETYGHPEEWAKKAQQLDATLDAQRDANARQADRLREVAAENERLREALNVVNANGAETLVEQRDTLRRAIVEHRTAIHNAGTVRVDHRDEPVAEAKHAADQRLWGVLDHA